MIYTGYFARLKYYQSNGLTPVRISNGGNDIVELYVSVFIPDWSIVISHKNGLISNDQYRKHYMNQLDSIDKNSLSSVITELDNRNAILLCYEAPGKFCHRHILAEYIRNNFNIDVKEYKVI